MIKQWDSMNNKKSLEKYVYTLSPRLRYVTHHEGSSDIFIYVVDIMFEESDLVFKGSYLNSAYKNGLYGISDLRFEDKECKIFVLNNDCISSEYCHFYNIGNDTLIVTPRLEKALNFDYVDDWDEEYKKLSGVEDLDITQDKRGKIQKMLDGIQSKLNILWYDRKKNYVIAVQTDSNSRCDYRLVLNNVECKRHNVDGYTLDVITYKLVNDISTSKELLADFISELTGMAKKTR